MPSWFEIEILAGTPDRRNRQIQLGRQQMAKKGPQWIRFLRHYGPISRIDNMYDELIRDSALRSGLEPLLFAHPVEKELLSLFSETALTPTSVILTGTAGDGKTHLCRRVWEQLGGSDEEWRSNNAYFFINKIIGGKERTIHIVRDLTGLPETGESGRFVTKTNLLEFFSDAIFEEDPNSVFLIAANDGQLVDTWARLNNSKEHVDDAGRLLEDLLFNNQSSRLGSKLKLFNLSRVSSAMLFDLSLEAFTKHEGWKHCYDEAESDNELFGSNCPIRHNYELLKSDLVRTRLRCLLELCDHNEVHLSIRRILLLLSNAVLGFAGNEAMGKPVNDRLLRAVDVPRVIASNQVAKASFYNNIFGGNLSDFRRDSLDIFEYFGRFRIGHETTNRFDNLLIYGNSDVVLKGYFEELLSNDKFYGADQSYLASQRDYIEGSDEGDQKAGRFLAMLVSQRRGLFFKIPDPMSSDFSPWDLTVFNQAGDYIERVLQKLRANQRVEKAVLAKLAKGLNRVFIGMLISSDRELLIATGLSGSSAKVSFILEDRVSVARRMTECIDIVKDDTGFPTLRVSLTDSIHVDLRLTLTRFQFLSRVSDGVLPGSFSKECHEDILAYKARLLAASRNRREQLGIEEDTMTFRILELDDLGHPLERVVELDR